MDDHYASRQRRWFETIAHYNPNDEFSSIFYELAPDGWRISKEAIWFVALPPDARLADQGWKIHVSAPTRDAQRVLRKALPVLFEKGVHFKFAADIWLTGEINSKLWPREASGKFLTVYPNTERDFLDIGDALSCRLDDIVGPYILSDRRWPGSKSVYYRYGSFTNRTVLRADGLKKYIISNAEETAVEDVRTPYWQPPDWVIDPHQKIDTESESQGKENSHRLKNGRYTVKSAITFSNRGGVYNAYDEMLRREVVLKEARPFVEIGRTQADSMAVIENEFNLLRELEGTGYFVRVLDLFHEWEHLYLVEERLTGETLGRFVIGHNPLYSGSVTSTSVHDYLELMLPIWLKIARAVSYAHQRCIIIGDLSVNNVIITNQGDVKIIDLESAALTDSTSIGLFTPGFVKPSVWESGIADESNDVYAIGGIIFGSLFLANNFISYYPDALDRFLDELAVDMGIPNSLITFVRLLMSEDNVSADAVVERLGEIALEVGSRRGIMPRLAHSGDVRMVGRTKADLQKATQSTLVGIVDYLNKTADLSRHDRLFPSDMLVFSTNPISVAYGASGIVYTIKTITGEVNSEFVDWILKASRASNECPPGLYLGKAGVAWVLDEIGYTELAIKLINEIRTDQLLWETPDVLYGAAGYGLLCARMWQKYRIQGCLDDAVNIGDWLSGCVVNGDLDVRWVTSEGMTRLGYANGGSGISLFLLYLSLMSGDETYAQLGRSALDFEVKQADWLNGRFIGFPSEIGGESSPYWIAGTAGVVTALLRYYAVYKDERVLENIRSFERDLMHKYAKFPQLFMGLAGLGNCLLDLWQFMGEEGYLTHAWQTAEGVLLHRIIRPEGVTFPGTRALRESGDFATGASGVGLFLHRLLEAERMVRDRGSIRNFNFTVDELLPGLQRSSSALIMWEPTLEAVTGRSGGDQGCRKPLYAEKREVRMAQ